MFLYGCRVCFDRVVVLNCLYLFVLKNMKESRSFIILCILSIIVIVGLVSFAVIQNRSSFRTGALYDGFAQCLADKGVKMYGAYWCSHCANQKKLFGDSWKKMMYVECSLSNKGGQTEECKQAKIEGYPTWEFANGSRIEQEVTLEELSTRTSCPLPSVPTETK